MRRRGLLILLMAILPVQWVMLLAIASIACAALAFLGTWEWDFGWPGSWLLSIDFWRGTLGRPIGVWGLAVPAALTCITQNAFLWFALERSDRPGADRCRPWLPAAIAAPTGGFLTWALLLTTADADASLGGRFGLLKLLDWFGGIGDWLQMMLFWCVIIAGALIWIPILNILARWRGQRSSRGVHAWLAGWLLAFAGVETMIVLVVDGCIRWGTGWPWDSERGMGTFFALWGLTWALLWLSGPVLILVLVHRRRRRLADVQCLHCGYAKGPTPGRYCPECGYEWRCADK